MKENTQKGQIMKSRRDGQREEGIHELKKKRIRKTGMAQEEREQERETMDKIPYATLNLQNNYSILGTTGWWGTC